MVSARKRGRQEMEAVEPHDNEPSLLHIIRNMWEFANLAQWIFIFGKAVKMDDNLDIEDLEMECLKSQSKLLPAIGLALLKFISSHRGLTWALTQLEPHLSQLTSSRSNIFDEYTRRQYLSKAPDRNPFGTEEEPAKFDNFDIFTKIRVLQQMTQWTMMNPERLRERMEEQKDSEQTFWRIEAFGWDSDDRTYIVLDDNRLYRLTEPSPPPPPPHKAKKNTKKARADARASKRRRLSRIIESDADDADETETEDKKDEIPEYDGLGGMTWECLAVTLDELQIFIASIAKSRDPNERVLKTRLEDELLPILEKQEESRKRKAAQKEKELLNLEKLATAKRSSRIAGKLEQQKQDDEARDAERKRHAELATAKKEQEKWSKLEKERESRMMTRERRLNEREARRILHEQELAELSEDNKKLEAGDGRISERHLKAQMDRKKQELEELEDDEDWIFDCICGAYGQIDDGSHSIACERCNIWQHSKCVGIKQADAEREDFHFVCSTCKRRVEGAGKAKSNSPIKLKFTRPSSSSSQSGTPMTLGNNSTTVVEVHKSEDEKLSEMHVQDNAASHGHAHINGATSQSSSASAPNSLLKDRNEKVSAMTPARQQSSSKTSPHSPTIAAATSTHNGSSNANGQHAFSSPMAHSPTSLPPPVQPRAYSTTTVQQDISSGENLNGTLAPNLSGPTDMTDQLRAAPPATPHSPSRISSHEARNGQSHRPSEEKGQHRQPASVPSPFSRAPDLSPSSVNNKGVSPRGGNTLSGAESASSLLLSSSFSSSSQQQQPQQANKLGSSSPSMPHPAPTRAPDDLADPNQYSSALPPASSGISPTKHSPPPARSAAAAAPNGQIAAAAAAAAAAAGAQLPATPLARGQTKNSASATASAATAGTATTTPSALPPVDPLSPSPRLQNLSPPVKHH